jgi:hypothetical protein
MKTQAAILGALAALVLAGCGTSSSGSGTAVSGSVPATSGSVVAAGAGDSTSNGTTAPSRSVTWGTYATVGDLKDAYVAVGGACDKWKAATTSSGDTSESGSCGKGEAELMIARSPDAYDALYKAAQASKAGAYLLAGDNWIIVDDEAGIFSTVLHGTIDSASGPEPASEDEPAEEYAQISAREWKLLVKDPDAYAGETVIVYGVIHQFDAATGTENFLAMTDNSKHSDRYSYTENASFTGSEKRLADFVEGDMFVAKVMVSGSYSYDTQAGGNTTVPEFEIDSIKRLH